MSQADDELAIRQLAAAYTDATNCRSPEGMAGVYAPDGELTVAGRTAKPIKGHAKLLLGFQRLMEQREFLFQMTLSGVVEVRGDTAVSRWWFSEIRKPTGSEAYIYSLGVYQDEVVRLAEGWRYARRSASGLFVCELPLDHDVHNPRPPFLPMFNLPGRIVEPGGT